MDLQLRNKTVFVTASGQGIGKEIAEVFLSEGARVVINDHNETRLIKTYKYFKKKFGNSVLAVAGDATDQDFLIKIKTLIIKKWKKIDIIVPNLGSGVPLSQDNFETNEWQRFLNINVKSVLLVLNVFLPIMKKQRSGSIIVLSSIAGVEATSAPFGYAAAKAGLLTLIKNSSRKLASFGIRINAVVPGNVYFKGGRWEEIVKNNKSILKKYIHSEVPLQRFGTPREIANAVVFLASPLSSFTTGSKLIVDGGETKSY